MTVKLCTACGEPNPSSHSLCSNCTRANRFNRWTTDPRSFLRTVVNDARWRAKKREIPFDIDAEWVWELWDRQNGRCALSGVHLTHHRGTQDFCDTNASLDRIRNHEGYTRWNTQLVAFRVNALKSNMDEGQFVWWLKTLNSYIEERISENRL